jgi:hypothetical protein
MSNLGSSVCYETIATGQDEEVEKSSAALAAAQSAKRCRMKIQIDPNSPSKRQIFAHHTSDPTVYEL